MTERVTLITGASAGIGAELARVFASNGHRVALVARRADRLRNPGSLKSWPRAARRRSSFPATSHSPMSATRSPRSWRPAGVEVEYVVNNAGFGLVRPSRSSCDRAEQLGIIAVNIRALTDLSLRFSDQLIRNRGGISMSARSPGFCRDPAWRFIMPSKAYVLSFTEALHEELGSARCAGNRALSRPGAVRISGARRI